MSTLTMEVANEADTARFQWNWRLAQQAFAEILGNRRTDGSLSTARALAALSALSADERPAFDRWLALQLFNRNDIVVARGMRNLAAVDAALPAAVRRQLQRVVAELAFKALVAAAA